MIRKIEYLLISALHRIAIPICFAIIIVENFVRNKLKCDKRTKYTFCS